jgi:hypothetical protein
MSFEENYYAAEHHERLGQKENARDYYEKAMRDVLPTHLIDQHYQVKHTIHFLEHWLNQQPSPWDNSLKALATWYDSLYDPTLPRVIDNELNFAPKSLDDDTRFECSLHQYWRSTARSASLSPKQRLEHIFALKQERQLILAEAVPTDAIFSAETATPAITILVPIAAMYDPVTDQMNITLDMPTPHSYEP